MKNSDSEFKDWLMAQRGEMRHVCQQQVVDRAMAAMDGERPFPWWAEGEYLRIRQELVAGFPHHDHSDLLRLSREGTAMLLIKNKWDNLVRNRVAEMNPPKPSGKTA